MPPVVAVALNVPPTVLAAKSNAVALTTEALPVVPLVFTLTAPVEASVPRSIVPFAADVVAVVVPGHR